MQTSALNKFPLLWRWTDPGRCMLSDEELSLIEPLDEEEANSVWKKSLSFISKERQFSPNTKILAEIDEISCDESSEISDVGRWLKQKIKPEKIIVSWGPGVAVIVCAELFIQHWSDFCYPSSDDISIWPLDEKWVVHYWHFEVFCYGRLSD